MDITLKKLQFGIDDYPNMIHPLLHLIIFILAAVNASAQHSYAIKNVSDITMVREEVLSDQTVPGRKSFHCSRRSSHQ
jgi:hypothetical protein